MCGIAGITWNDTQLAARMAARIAHRGPDQSGLYADGQVTLAHQRLSILDLSDRGRQPMCSNDGSIALVFNGEIYNFIEIRQELEAKGHVFQSECDTEVIVQAYLRWGTECVQHFNGMFAFALWDRQREEIIMARDRIGIKPLYYALTNDSRNLVFASEIKAVLECAQVSTDIDPESLYQFLGFEFVPAPNTIFRKVHKLPPGHILRWQRGRPPIVERYWRLQIRSVRRSRREHEQMLRELLERSVRRQLIADVPLGVFLSGGLDSSAIVSMMSRLGVAPLDTFSLHYEDASFSELEYAQYVAEKFHTRHHVIKIDPITPDLIATCCWHLDEPMTDLSAMPFYLLCQKVKEHVTVCLSGEGGDELFCGYDRFKASKLNRYYRLLPRFVRQNLVKRIMDAQPDRPQKKGLVNMLKRFVEGDALPDDGRHMRWQYFCTPRIQHELFRPDRRTGISFDPFLPIRDLLQGADCEGAVAEEIYMDMCMTMPESLLMKADKMSMAHALEVRVPFLDHEFAEFCCTIPSDMKLQGFTTKAIFRSAMKGILPDRIRLRGKQGYSLPIKNWLRGELRDYMEDSFSSSDLIGNYFDRAFIRRLIDEHNQLKANHNHVLWALLNLAVWHQVVALPKTRSAEPALAT